MAKAAAQLIVVVVMVAAVLLGAGCSDSDGASDAEGGHPVSTTLPANITPPAGLMPLARLTGVTAGAYHTCVLDAEGAAQCWGSNESGQLGDGTAADRALPGSVQGINEGIAQMVGGFSNTCAITTSSGLKCWGANQHGEAGTGDIGDAVLTPTQVTGMETGVTQVAIGREHACALAGGTLSCWGDNAFGQLGDGTTEQRPAPVAVAGLNGDVVSFGTGWYHTCALLSPGQVMCWGNNQTAQLGPGAGESSRSNAPIVVEGLPTGVVALAVGGGHNCVLTGHGAVWCWGANNYGQTGDGTTTDRRSPLQVEGLDGGAQAIFAGTGQSCALLRSGGVRCWGHDWYGELGDGTKGEGNVQLEQVDVLGLPTGVTSISMGRFHTCALTDGGAVWCWGRNGFGEIGDGTRAERLAPVTVVETP